MHNFERYNVIADCMYFVELKRTTIINKYKTKNNKRI